MSLTSHIEHCIIDNTPQFSEATGFIKSTKRRAPCIRANTTQAVRLKKAYEQSSVLSSAQAKALAEETGLPHKWILQWFGRQRTKERKNANYKPGLDGPNDVPATESGESSNPPAFSALFSESGSGTLVTDISAQDIKSEYRDGSLTPLSGSNLEPFPTPELPAVHASASHVAGRIREGNVVQGPRTLERQLQTARNNHKALHSRRAPRPVAQTTLAGSRAFRLLILNSPAESTTGLRLSDGVQSDIDAYTQSSSPPTSQESRNSTPSAHQVFLPRIGPPQRSPIVSSNVTRLTGAETQTRHSFSRLSAVNLPVDESKVSLHQGDSRSVPISAINYHKNVSFSVFQSQLYHYSPWMSTPGDTPLTVAPQIARPVPHSQPFVLAAENHLPHDPLFAVTFSCPDLVEPDFAMDSCLKTSCADFPDALSSFHQDAEIMVMEPMFSEAKGRQAVTATHLRTAEYRTPAFNPDHLEALDPSRAPLKHLTGILKEYRDENGTYLSLLVGLQDPTRRREIIGCLSNDDLVLHDPFVAAMGLALLSRLGVL